MIQCIVKFVKKTTMEHKKASLFWGVVEDESIDISMNTHMIVYLLFLEHGWPAFTYINFDSNTKNHQSNIIVNYLEIFQRVGLGHWPNV